MIVDLMKAFAVGVCASAPLGPVAIWVFQKSLSKGAFPAFIGGLGAAAVDTLYAAISLFALAFVQEFISCHESVIMIAGGLIVIFVGIRISVKKTEEFIDSNGVLHKEKASFSDFVTTAGMALANPGALALMLTIVALFGLDITETPAPGVLILLMVLSGATSFWFLFSMGVGLFRRAIKAKHLLWVNRVTGFAVAVFGAILLVKGSLMVF